MSYCRFGWDGSDVYVISTSNSLECIMCGLHSYEDHSNPNATGWAAIVGITTLVPDDIPDSFGGPDANQQMIEHLLEHRKRGHTVPEDALEALRDPEDAKVNQEHWAQYRKEEPKPWNAPPVA